MNNRILLVAVGVFTLGIGAASAGTDSDARVAKLEQTVQLLEKRVMQLEAQLHATSAPTNAPAPISVPSGKESWRKLHSGMKQAEVEQLMGSPTKVDAYGSFSIWRFGNRGGGEVQFDDSGRVTGWHEPN